MFSFSKCLKEYLRSLEDSPFRLKLLFNPLYLIPRVFQIRSISDLSMRLANLEYYLRDRYGRPRKQLKDQSFAAEEVVRHRTIRLFAKGRGIDIGAGSGVLSLGSASLDRLDFDPLLKNSVDFFSSCDKIPAEDGSYDFAIASHLMEHLLNPVKAIREWSRILKPGGVLIVFMPDCRIYIPDRKRFEIVELRSAWMADLPLLLESYRNEIPNSPPASLNSSRFLRLFSGYYNKHHFLWHLRPALQVFKALNFEVLFEKESPLAFFETFNARILPNRLGKPYLASQEEEFSREILDFQRGNGFPELDYSFILVLRNPGKDAVDSALERLLADTYEAEPGSGR